MTRPVQKPALKSDIQGLDQKIDASTRSLALELVKTNGRIDSLEEKMGRTISENTDRILTALDRYSRVVEADNRAAILHGAVLTEVQLKLQDHAQRLGRLEGSQGQPGR